MFWGPSGKLRTTYIEKQTLKHPWPAHSCWKKLKNLQLPPIYDKYTALSISYPSPSDQQKLTPQEKKHTSTNQKSKTSKSFNIIQHPNAASHHQSFLSPCIISHIFWEEAPRSINIPSPSNFVWRLPRRTPHPTREAPSPPASRPHLGTSKVPIETLARSPRHSNGFLSIYSSKGETWSTNLPPDSICGHGPNLKNPPLGPGLLKAVSFMTCWKNFWLPWVGWGLDEAIMRDNQQQQTPWVYHHRSLTSNTPNPDTTTTTPPTITSNNPSQPSSSKSHHR